MSMYTFIVLQIVLQSHSVSLASRDVIGIWSIYARAATDRQHRLAFTTSPAAATLLAGVSARSCALIRRDGAEWRRRFARANAFKLIE